MDKKKLKTLKKHSIEIIKLEPKYPIILPSFKYYCQQLVDKGFMSNLIIDYNTGNEYSNSGELHLKLFEHDGIKSILQGESNSISILVGGIRYFIKMSSADIISGCSGNGDFTLANSSIIVRRTNSLLIIAVLYHGFLQRELVDTLEEVIDLLIKNNKHEELLSNIIND